MYSIHVDYKVSDCNFCWFILYRMMMRITVVVVKMIQSVLVQILQKVVHYWKKSWNLMMMTTGVLLPAL